MKVVELTADDAKGFVSKHPITAILYFAPGDHRVYEVIGEFKSVASTFHEHVGFGLVDLTAAANSELLKEGVVVVTPTVVYYRFGKPAGEDIGHDAIARWLDHDSLVHIYGHTDSWLKLLR